jgi:hypothetical protein
MACLQQNGVVAALPAASCNGWVVLEPSEYLAWMQPQLQSREQNFSDGMALGWAIAGVVIAAWVVRQIAEYVRGSL